MYEVSVRKVGGIEYGESGIQTLAEARQTMGLIVCVLAVEDYSIVNENDTEIVLVKNRHNMIKISIKEN